MFYLATKGYIITEDGELIPIDNDDEDIVELSN